MDFGGLMAVNIELSSMCDKKCSVCGRRKRERDFPESVDYGFMDFNLLENIAQQLPQGRLLLQFHNNGEPLLYPYLREGLQLFKNHIRCFDTNGNQLINRFDDIVDNVDTITVSMLPEDEIWELQYETLIKFLKKKGDRFPNVIIRLTGHFDEKRRKLYEDTGCFIVDRILHDPMGSWKYQYPTVKPETGICLEMIGKLSIDRYGNVSPCVRFDPNKELVIANLNEMSLLEIWNSPKRQEWLNLHVQMRRREIPFCSKCEYWGIPRGEK